MHFRILKMIATSGFQAALECTKVIFGWGANPDPNLQCSLMPPSGFKTGPTSKGKERGGERRGRGRSPNAKFLGTPLLAVQYCTHG